MRVYVMKTDEADEYVAELMRSIRKEEGVEVQMPPRKRNARSD